VFGYTALVAKVITISMIGWDLGGLAGPDVQMFALLAGTLVLIYGMYGLGVVGGYTSRFAVLAGRQ
jgi:hypothetical protein